MYHLRRYPHSWRDTLPGVIPMGAIPPGVATQSAAGTPSTADYYGKKNIYIYAYEYNSLCVDIRMGGSRGETITWVALSISRVAFFVGGVTCR